MSEEATQQTFLQAWRAAARVDISRELGPWLATIARRAAIDLYRHEARRRGRSLDSLMSDHPALATPDLAPEDLYRVWEVRRALSELPEQEHEIVRLQHREGLTHTQIAARLRVPVGTVKSRSFRAHARVAIALAHVHQESPPALHHGAAGSHQLDRRRD